MDFDIEEYLEDEISMHQSMFKSFCKMQREDDVTESMDKYLEEQKMIEKIRESECEKILGKIRREKGK